MKSLHHIWPVVRLHQVIIDMQPGFAQRPNIENVGVPQLRTNNISPAGNLDLSELVNVKVSVGELEKYGVRKGDVVFNNTNSVEWVGKTAFFNIDEAYVLSNHMTRIRVDTSLLDAEFLAKYLHYLWQTRQSGSRAKQWVNQAAIDQTMLAEFEILLPPLPEQRRIVAILRQADRLRRLRQEADEKARQLLPALFYEMFGDCDPHKEYPEGWRVAPLTSIVAEAQYGLSTSLKDDGDVGVLRMNNITVQGELDFTDLKYLSLKEVDFNQYGLQSGDILFNRTNSKELVGKTGLWEEREGLYTFASYIIRVRLKPTVSPEYIWALLNGPYGKQQVFALGKQAVNMANINTQELGSIPIVLPPIALQKRFARFYRVFKDQAKLSNKAKMPVSTLFQSLLAQAFSGELTAAWREEHKGLEAAQVAAKLPQRSEATFLIAEEVSTPQRIARVNERDVVTTLSDEQWQVLELVRKSKGYCTVETLRANSELAVYAIRQGLQLLEQTGLIQAVQLPDRPIRNVVYIAAYRDVIEEDRVREMELDTLQKGLQEGMML